MPPFFICKKCINFTKTCKCAIISIESYNLFKECFIIMKLSMFKSRRINPLFVLCVAVLAIPVLLVLEYAMTTAMVFGICNDCFEKAGMLLGVIFAMTNIINVSIVVAVAAVAVIICNRICVAEYKANTVKVRKITAIQRKRSEARRAHSRIQCTEEWSFV